MSLVNPSRIIEVALAQELYEACVALQSEAAARGCGLRIADEAIEKSRGGAALTLALSPELRAAIMEALAESSHTLTCNYTTHFMHLNHVRSAARREKMRVELLQDAPACSCWVGRLAASSGITAGVEE